MVRVSCRQPFETVAISTPPVFPRCLYSFFDIILQWHASQDLLLFFPGMAITGETATAKWFDSTIRQAAASLVSSITTMAQGQVGEA